MKEIVFVTTNKGKIASAQKSLKDVQVIPYEAELIEPRSDDIEEIALAKVKQAYDLTKKPCIAMDAGFYIDRWNDFPKAYVNPMLETLGLEGLLKLMENEDYRNCHFKQCLAYYDGNVLKTFISKDPGQLSTSIDSNYQSHQWSALWYIFKPLDYSKTLSQFTDEDFLAYGKRSEPSSLRQFGLWFNDMRDHDK